MVAEGTWKNPHDFATAVQYLAEGHHIDYEVKINGHSGALMTREQWLEDSEDGGMFTDDDGMGNEVDKDGNILGVRPHRFEGEGKTRRLVEVGDPGYIYPSQRGRLRPETAYILWYNK